MRSVSNGYPGIPLRPSLQAHTYYTREYFFSKLMYWAESQQDGYLIDLDGPISPFVHATTRYGRQFAVFLPALLLCEQRRMAANVYPPQTGAAATYRLDHTSSLRTHFRQSGLFDSRLEADFAREFEEKFGGKRGQR